MGSTDRKSAPAATAEKSRGELEKEIEHLRSRLAELEVGSPSVAPGEVYLAGGLTELRDVLNNINAGIVAHGSDTSIRVCNPMACEILGLTMEQMIGKTVPDPQWKFLREDGSDMPIEEYPASVVLGAKTILRNQVVGVHRPAKDDLVWVLVNGFPVLDDDGQLRQAIITFIDITEWRKVTEEREKLEEQLRQSQKMEAIGQLAGGVAHDFNNILTGIIGYTDLVLGMINSGSELHSHIEEIRKGGDRAAELTGQLLSFARKQIIDPRVIQLNEIVGESEKMLRRLIDESILLEVVLAKDLQSVLSDPGQLEQVLVNLVVNSRDAMPEGGRLTIETANVTLEDEPCHSSGEVRSGDFVMLAVSDSGVGMDAETSRHIFEPFFTTKPKGEGTGLGLSTVFGIVKQNGGFVSVYSELGSGTTLKVYLPTVVEEAEPLRKGVAAGPSAGTETVLLVEDDEMVRELSRKILATHGYTVLEAGSADEACLLGSRYSGVIHLLLTDVVMPNMNGLELSKLLQSERPDLKTLFMSGYTDNVIAHHGILESGTNFLSKPFTVASLATAVRDVLDGES